MKAVNIFLLTVVGILLLSMPAAAQVEFVSVGINPSSAFHVNEPISKLDASVKAKTPGLDFTIKAGFQSKNIEIAVVYQNWASIDFQQYSANINGLSYPFTKTEVALGIELGRIIREGNSGDYFIGANAELRYQLNSHFFTSLQINLRSRSDIKYFYDMQNPQYRLTPFINVGYKF